MIYAAAWRGFTFTFARGLRKKWIQQRREVAVLDELGDRPQLSTRMRSLFPV